MSGLLVFGRTGQVARELQQLAPVLPLGRDEADLVPVLRPSTPTAPAR